LRALRTNTLSKDGLALLFSSSSIWALICLLSNGMPDREISIQKVPNQESASLDVGFVDNVSRDYGR
jgi:hypothetical protein